MKRFVYAAAAIALTGVLVLLAMAVAQRDARVSDTSAIENDLPYANQPAQPISGNNIDGLGQEYSDANNWPPVPIVRGNDSPPSTHATLTAYSGENSILPSRSDIQGNIRKSTFDGQLVEPPTLDGNALNSFISNTSNPSYQVHQILCLACHRPIPDLNRLETPFSPTDCQAPHLKTVIRYRWSPTIHRMAHQ